MDFHGTCNRCGEQRDLTINQAGGAYCDGCYDAIGTENALIGVGVADALFNDGKLRKAAIDSAKEHPIIAGLIASEFGKGGCALVFAALGSGLLAVLLLVALVFRTS